MAHTQAITYEKDIAKLRGYLSHPRILVSEIPSLAACAGSLLQSHDALTAANAKLRLAGQTALDLCEMFSDELAELIEKYNADCRPGHDEEQIPTVADTMWKLRNAIAEAEEQKL